MPKSTKNLRTAHKKNIPLDLSIAKSLKEAVLEGNYASVKHLLKNGANPNEQDADGLTPLHLAAIDNRMYIINLLLQHGALIMIKDNKGHTALDYVLQFNYNSIINIFSKKLTNPTNINYCSFFTDVFTENLMSDNPQTFLNKAY